ncbi:unnamed protein product [Pelagomonas calceolata]|uniref:Uncharacterized protein n=1 Tax=Pelagomonas calceolata TaxID=35677 RepID=A0A8J2WXT3_9STRA|nr:unnamed protein product [Pelagomonas calceolata]
MTLNEEEAVFLSFLLAPPRRDALSLDAQADGLPLAHDRRGLERLPTTHDALDEVGVVADLGREEALAVPAERKLARECQEPTLVEAPRPAGAPAELCRAVGEAPRPRDLDLVVAAPQHAELPLGPDEIRWRIGLLGGRRRGVATDRAVWAQRRAGSDGVVVVRPHHRRAIRGHGRAEHVHARRARGQARRRRRWHRVGGGRVERIGARRAPHARARWRRGAEASRAPTEQP